MQKVKDIDPRRKLKGDGLIFETNEITQTCGHGQCWVLTNVPCDIYCSYEHCLDESRNDKHLCDKCHITLDEQKNILNQLTLAKLDRLRHLPLPPHGIFPFYFLLYYCCKQSLKLLLLPSIHLVFCVMMKIFSFQLDNSKANFQLFYSTFSKYI